jgi:hypothetical protein
MLSRGPIQADQTVPPVTSMRRSSVFVVGIPGDLTAPAPVGPGPVRRSRDQLQIQLGLDVAQLLPENTLPAPAPSQRMSKGELPDRWFPVTVSNAAS